MNLPITIHTQVLGINQAAKPWTYFPVRRASALER